MIVALTVLFKPSPEVYRNIRTYLDEVNYLYLVDNSPDTSSLLEKLLLEEKVKLLSSSINLGIAEAYNLGLQNAYKDGYHWLMTMDQDSFFEFGQINNFLEDFSRVPKNNLGIYAPLHNPKFLSRQKDEPVSIVMSSASIVNVDMALKLGSFDKALFIDEVDHEFCLKIQKNDFIVLQNRSVYLNHCLGREIRKGLKKYSSTRLYYMTRNHLYIKNKYQHLYPLYFKKRISYMRKFLFGQLFNHENKLHRTMMIFLGIRDYYLGKMGKRYEF